MSPEGVCAVVDTRRGDRAWRGPTTVLVPIGDKFAVGVRGWQVAAYDFGDPDVLEAGPQVGVGYKYLDDTHRTRRGVSI
jgi:hypothetical protein